MHHVVKQCLQHPPRGYPCSLVPNTCGDASILLSKYLNGHVGRVPYFAASKVAENPVVTERMVVIRVLVQGIYILFDG